MILNNVVINEPIIMGSDLVIGALSETNNTETPYMVIDWVCERDIISFLDFLSNEYPGTCCLKTYKLIDYFLLTDDYLQLCYNGCDDADKFRIRQMKDITGRPIGLTENDIQYLRLEGYSEESLLKEADESMLLKLNNVDIKAVLDSILPFDIDSMRDCYLVGEFVYSLIRFSNYRNPQEHCLFESEDSWCIIDICCPDKQSVNAIVNSLNSCIVLNHYGQIYIFPLNSCVLIRITLTDNILSCIEAHELDCFKVIYGNGNISGIPSFHLCMINNWRFDLKKPIDAWQLCKYRDRIDISNLNSSLIDNDEGSSVQSSLNKYLVWRGETPERFLYLASTIYKLDFTLY
jgi:hypothetical protein